MNKNTVLKMDTYMGTERNRRKKTMKGIMFGIFFMCWLLPMLLMIGVAGYYIFSKHFVEAAESAEKELEFNSRICTERLNQSIRLSRAATLDQEIENSWNRYKKDEISYHTFYLDSASYLSNQYRQREELKHVVFWCYENPEEMRSSVYNSSSGGSYQQTLDYWQQDHEAVYNLAKELDTTARFISLDDRLYLVRNLMSRSYTPIGALVMRLNTDYCLGPLKQFPMIQNATVWLNDQELLLKGEGFPGQDIMENGYERGKDCIFVNQSRKEQDYTFAYRIQTDNSLTQAPLYGYRYVFTGMALFLFPLFFVLLMVFKKHITEPVSVLMDGASHISEGEMGYQIEYEPDNREFHYLRDEFNTMSARLKYQFEHIYEEELALRDARIMALQSNINPHFMNNTLEIINWEARMGDNAKVSKMIEALSTLMDAAMDRKRKAEVTLSEEMVYVEAYLYIISERFGKRLTIEKRLSNDTMHIMVPRLILQPVIENAIEHGGFTAGHGTVTIESRLEGKYLYLDIQNDGDLKPEDEKKIKCLLAPDYDTSKESSGNLGIANVNQRLKIIYGDECGLTITRGTGENKTVLARLTILAEKNTFQDK